MNSAQVIAAVGAPPSAARSQVRSSGMSLVATAPDAGDPRALRRATAARRGLKHRPAAGERFGETPLPSSPRAIATHLYQADPELCAAA